jgi:hypothetical protein
MSARRDRGCGDRDAGKAPQLGSPKDPGTDGARSRGDAFTRREYDWGDSQAEQLDGGAGGKASPQPSLHRTASACQFGQRSLERRLEGLLFHIGDEVRIDPLTISDNYSRYLFRCQSAKAADTAHSKPVFAAAFREFGLPRRIRTDNGAPFGSNGETGLTALSAWWIQLGIVPERIHIVLNRSGSQSGSPDALLWGAALDAAFLVLASWFFNHIYRHAVRTGLIARYSAESLS